MIKTDDIHYIITYSVFNLTILIHIINLKEINQKEKSIKVKKTCQSL